ncbi:MAG TPA: carbon-nitrogen hydrolase family protein [Gemmataceae bacterium]|nr:carbon-nitrogen hydrolase family protein [Gemmataceae bacterium]
MTSWKIAGVQMDCRLGEKRQNLERVRERLHTAAGQGARLIGFPECVLTGYGFDSKEEAMPHAEPLPGPSTDVLTRDCRELDVWTIVGLLERDAAGNLFNACALLGPGGECASYRKIHLPYLGVDRFTTPGDRPFAVHDLGGLRIGINICYDGGFPESARVLALLGADLVVLPTNWPPGALTTVKYLIPARALENHIYYLAVNRVGEERGFRFIGQSRVLDCTGEPLATSGDGEEILYAEIDPLRAREKHIVHIAGKYEIDRVGDRRPEMYGPICATKNK